MAVNTLNTVIANCTILSLICIGVIYLCIWSQAPPRSIVSIQNYNPCSQSYSSVPSDKLEAALRRASTDNMTVIVTIVNKAYVEPYSESYLSMFDLFLESFWLGEETRPLINNLLVVAIDQTAYDRCKFKRLNCYKLGTNGADFTGEQFFMSDDFLKMMWRRTLFLSEVLKRGYSFIFTDTDILWLRNPFPRLRRKESDDLLISTDFSDNPKLEEFINTGFYYVRSNNKTISLFEKWYSMRDNSKGLKEQDVLIKLRTTGVFRQLGLNVRVLDVLSFNGFCSNRTDIRAVTTVHANCCRSIIAKVTDLTGVLRDWNKFRANGTEITQWVHFNCYNSWK